MSHELNDNDPLSPYFKRFVNVSDSHLKAINESFPRDKRTQLRPGRLSNFFSSAIHALARHPEDSIMGIAAIIAFSLERNNWVGALTAIGIIRLSLVKIMGDYSPKTVLKLKAEFCDRAVNRELKAIHALGDIDFSPTQQKHKQRAQEKFMASIRHRRDYIGYNKADNDEADNKPKDP